MHYLSVIEISTIFVLWVVSGLRAIMLLSFFAVSCLLLLAASAVPVVSAAVSSLGGGACEFDFKVFVYPLADTAHSLPSVRLEQEARRNSSYHVCVGCIYVCVACVYIVCVYAHAGVFA